MSLFRIRQLVRLYFCVLLVSFARNGHSATYSFKPDHHFGIVATTGSRNIVAIGKTVSLNQVGDIAFFADVQIDGRDTHQLFTGRTDDNGLWNVSARLTEEESSLVTILGPELQINDGARVLFRSVVVDDSPFGPVTTTFLNVWNYDGTERLGSLLAGRALNSPPELRFIDSYVAFNNHGNATFFGLVGNGRVIASRPTSGTASLSQLIDLVPNTPITISDANSLVYRAGGSGGSIQMYGLPDIANRFFGRVASFRNGFPAIGLMPGMSVDGRIVVFYSNFSGQVANSSPKTDLIQTTGPGIFAFFHSTAITADNFNSCSLVRLAGLAGNDQIDPGEFYSDITRDGIFTPNIEEEIGLIRGLDPDSPICVNANGLVAFTGINERGKRCIFAGSLSVNNSDYPVGSPYEVVAVGDTIPGLNGEVADISLYRAVGGEKKPGQIAFWTKTSLGQEAVVVATKKVKPLIVVPGMSASTLAADTEVLWPSLFSPSNLRKLSLEPGKITEGVHPVDILRDVAGILDIHGKMIEMLVGPEARRELVPTISCSPDGCRYSIPPAAVQNSPDLFIFPYDWRMSSAINAIRLRQYIEAIRELYPGTHVDLVAHSMGGLVARRYLIDNSDDHFVDKCAIIAAPFLGAPVAYERILKGKFFGKPVIDPINNRALTEILPFFRGFHELLPSSRYFNQPRLPSFVEKSFDFNGNQIVPEDYVEHAQVEGAFDRQFPTQPVFFGNQFHSLLQEDWSSSGFGVKYLHVIGVQARDSTAIQAIAKRLASIGGEGPGDIEPQYLIGLKKGRGDGTVPYTSAFRTREMTASDAQIVIANGDGSSHVHPAEYRDDATEHVALTANPRVHTAIQYFLRTGNRLWSDPAPVDTFARPAARGAATTDHRELVVVGGVDVFVKNVDEEETQYVPGLGFLFPEGVSGDVDEQSAQLVYEPEGRFEFRIRRRVGGLSPVLIEITTADDNGDTVSAVRFLDVRLPEGGSARLIDNGVPPWKLEVDNNSDGVFDRTIDPSFMVTGVAAQDDLPPQLSAVRICRDGRYYLKIVGVDAGTGVDSIMYQGSRHGVVKYESEIAASTISLPEVTAFATDRAGNRSPPHTFPLVPALRTILASALVRVTWEKSCWPFILESSSKLGAGAAWNPVEAPIRDFGTENGVELPSSLSTRFFRLRLNPN